MNFTRRLKHEKKIHIERTRKEDLLRLGKGAAIIAIGTVGILTAPISIPICLILTGIPVEPEGAIYND